MIAPYNILAIHGLQLPVFIGWTEKERLESQIILIDIEIRFAKPPAACQTDELSHTLCYADLITHLQTQIGNKPFHLIEHLTYEIYQLIKNKLSQEARAKVTVHKHPSIVGLSGGVSFTYGDHAAS
jgi:7,8-dihydroneopterin aldolase/epimerase/oxygenase